MQLVDYKLTTFRPHPANTKDIIDVLLEMVPRAVKQIKDSNILKQIKLTGDLDTDAKTIAGYIKSKVTYLMDGYFDQNIQLPLRLFAEGKGDCKSFSLAFLAMMKAAGYDPGFRFAAYPKKHDKKNTKLTHVYNFVDDKKKLHIFDLCIKTLKESPKYNLIRDMRVNVLSGPPNKQQQQKVAYAQRKQPFPNKQAYGNMHNNAQGTMMLRQGNFAPARSGHYATMGDPNFIGKKGWLKKAFKKGFQVFKKVNLAPIRGAFLAVVLANFRGIAKRLSQLRAKNVKDYKEFWLKLGGNPNKLDSAVNKGMKRKPLFGMSKKHKMAGIFADEFYIGEPLEFYTMNGAGEPEYLGIVTIAALTAALTAAAAVLAAVSQIFKKNAIKDENGKIDDPGLTIKNPDGSIPEIADLPGEVVTEEVEQEESEIGCIMAGIGTDYGQLFENITKGAGMVQDIAGKVSTAAGNVKNASKKVNFKPADPDGLEARTYRKTGKFKPTLEPPSKGIPIVPIAIGGAALLAVVLLTKKSK